MIQTIAAAAAAIMLLSAEPAAQAGAAPTATEAKAPPKAAKDKVVCRMETPVGTRFGKRVCMSLAERERQEEEANKGFGEMQKVVSTNFSKGN